MKYKVLVADDEYIIRRGIMRFLKKYNKIEITAEAENGEQALEIAKKEPLDILFIDINMPILNGLQFIEQLKKVQPNAICVIITGYDDFEYARQALRLGVREYILKPLMEEVFDSAVQRVFNILDQRDEEDRYLNWAQDMVKKNKKYLISEFISDWMEGHFSKEEVIEKAEYLELEIPDDYLLTLISIEHLKREDEDNPWDDNLLYYALENISSEIYESLSPISITGTRNENLLMISRQAPMSDLEEINRNCYDLVQSYLPVKVTILQERGDSCFNIPESYQKLLERLEQLKTCPNIIKDIQQFIEQHYGEEELSLLDAAEYVNVSPQHLSRLFKKEIGVTFVDYLTKVRIRKSTELLAQGDMKIYEVAEKVGYSTQHYFSSVFKKTLGISPVEYRKGITEDTKGNS